MGARQLCLLWSLSKSQSGPRIAPLCPPSPLHVGQLTRALRQSRRDCTKKRHASLYAVETWRDKYLVWVVGGGEGGAVALAVSHIHWGWGGGWRRGELTCDVLVLMLLDLWLSYPYRSQLAPVNRDVMENLPPVPGRSQGILTHGSSHTIPSVRRRVSGVE